jgi:hypothetical protein
MFSGIPNSVVLGLPLSTHFLPASDHTTGTMPLEINFHLYLTSILLSGHYPKPVEFTHCHPKRLCSFRICKRCWLYKYRSDTESGGQAVLRITRTQQSASRALSIWTNMRHLRIQCGMLQRTVLSIKSWCYNEHRCYNERREIRLI